MVRGRGSRRLQHSAADLAAESPRPRAPATLEEFLSGVSARAFRFAELGLRHRDDALDAVQDAMLKMLGYRDRPASEWSPLFWSILRNRMTDMQRRGLFRTEYEGSTLRDHLGLQRPFARLAA